MKAATRTARRDSAKASEGKPQNKNIGNVNMVAYQPDSLDQFYHYYNYDDDNRLQAVYTSRNANWATLQAQQLPDIPNSPDWVLDGKQQYFWHGPMVRAELGEQQVQGLDYTYTLQGWLKAINSTFGTPYADGNQDGFNVMSFAQDAFGFELGYYNGDYKPVSNRPYNVIATQTGSSLQSLQTSLYNGNISYSVTSLPDSLQYTNLQLQQQPKASLYKYDQLNRLTKSLTLDLGADNIINNQWLIGFSTVPEFSVTNISYDANGNIMALNRNAEAGNTNMDALSYHYDGNTNKLLYVDDNTMFTTNHGEDIDDQAAGNYAYDAIGNLIQDNAEEIAFIEWTLCRKVKSIIRTALSQRPDLEFTYNAIGQRLSKKVTPKNGDKPTTTYYIYNAGGDCMATYKHTDINTSGIYYTETFKAEEYTIYGESRLGVEAVSIQLYEHTYSEMQGGGISTITEDYFTPTPQTTYTIQLGNKNYELNNHLGNVLVTLTDRKIPIQGGSYIDAHLPDIASVTDYYPYGMRIETRSWNITKYRFGFNGMERTNEVYGEGNEYTTEFRQLDVRLGRWFSTDFISKTWESPYSFCYNSPMSFIDRFGTDPIKRLGRWDRFNNWVRGDQFINDANKYAVEVGADEEDLKYGRSALGRYITVRTLEKKFSGEQQKTEGEEGDIAFTVESPEFEFQDKFFYDGDDWEETPIRIPSLGFSISYQAKRDGVSGKKTISFYSNSESQVGVMSSFEYDLSVQLSNGKLVYPRPSDIKGEGELNLFYKSKTGFYATDGFEESNNFKASVTTGPIPQLNGQSVKFAYSSDGTYRLGITTSKNAGATIGFHNTHTLHINLLNLSTTGSDY